MQSRRHHQARNRWVRCNSPDALRRRRAMADAKREAEAADRPPAYAGPEPLTVWRTVLVLDECGDERRRITLYVPTHGRCDQWAAEIDGERCAQMMTATAVGDLVASMVPKRPSREVLADLRRMG